MTTLLESNQQLGVRQRHGRAVNAVAEFLRHQFPKLSVPNIYIEPRLPLLSGVDVLAVDRAGSGDLLVVEIKESVALNSAVQLDRYVEALKKWPAHFKYIAIPSGSQPSRFIAQAKLFAKNGIGRIGILLVEESGLDFPSVKLFSPGERFVVDGQSMQRIEKALSKSKPDIEVRI